MGNKSVNNLYKPMLEHSNVEKKFHKAAKGKTERPDVAVILDPNNIQKHVENVIEQLENTAPEWYDVPHPEKAWKPSRHGKVCINEGTSKKTRMIEKPRYNYEQVIHHIVVAACYDIFIQKLKDVSIYLYTGNMRAGLKAAGFEVLTASKYLTSDAYLLEGDIILNDSAHVATNLTDGSKISGVKEPEVEAKVKVDYARGFDKSLVGKYKITASDFLALRAGAGTGKTLLVKMKPNETVQCWGYYTDVSGVDWLYIDYKGIVGFASSKYLKKQ